MSVSFHPKMSVWTQHFLNMAKGNVPVSDFYTVTREPSQFGNGLVLVTPTEAARRRAVAKVKKVYKRKNVTSKRQVKNPAKKRAKKPTKKKPVKKSGANKKWLSR